MDPNNRVQRLPNNATHTSRLSLILVWNANGINSKKDELNDYLIKHEIKIAAITETHLAPNNRWSIPGYIIYREDRPINGHLGGGVALIVHSSIKHNQIPIPQFQRLEAVGITIKLGQQQIALMSIYAPPGRSLTAVELTALQGVSPSFLAMGDINAKNTVWNCNANTANGLLLYRHQQTRNYMIHAPDEPTFDPARANARPDILDIVINKRVNTPFELQVMHELSSDHYPVHIVFEDETTHTNETRKVRNYRKTRWPQFREFITDSIPDLETLEIHTPQQLEGSVVNLTEIIQNGIDHCIPETEIKISNRELPGYIRLLITAKNRLRRRYSRHRDRDTKRRIN